MNPLLHQQQQLQLLHQQVKQLKYLLQLPPLQISFSYAIFYILLKMFDSL